MIATAPFVWFAYLIACAMSARKTVVLKDPRNPRSD